MSIKDLALAAKLREVAATNNEVVFQVTMNAREFDLGKFLWAIKKASDPGHGTNLIVDSDGDAKQEFYLDGDGGDSIIRIAVETEDGSFVEVPDPSK